LSTEKLREKIREVLDQVMYEGEYYVAVLCPTAGRPTSEPICSEELIELFEMLEEYSEGGDVP
jgi:hypothetical protein